MSKTCTHLSLEERALMQVTLDHDCSLRAIARKLHRSASTITREFALSLSLSLSLFSMKNEGLIYERPQALFDINFKCCTS